MSNELFLCTVSMEIKESELQLKFLIECEPEDIDNKEVETIKSIFNYDNPHLKEDERIILTDSSIIQWSSECIFNESDKQILIQYLDCY